MIAVLRRYLLAGVAAVLILLGALLAGWGVFRATSDPRIAVAAVGAMLLVGGAVLLPLTSINSRLGRANAVQRRDSAEFRAGMAALATLHKAQPTVLNPTAPPPPPAVPDHLLRLLQTPKTALPVRQEEPRWRTAREVPVAVIADEFTYRSFESEWDSVRLTPQNWRAEMERRRPALFFCESAWAGGTPPERPWRGQIYSTIRSARETRTELLQILQYCRDEGIPTVFWNKEDPIHFGDRVHDFVSTAALFDHVFTSAEECVDDYIRDADVQHVGALAFAVQPRLFNPFSEVERSDSAVFAGSWYPGYTRRARVAEQMLDLVISGGRELIIYDRMFHAPEGHQFPSKYDRYRHPAIPYEGTAAAYRAARFGITLNTITDSRTMFARRIFEMTACGAVALSNSSVGVDEYFGDAVILADQNPERFLELTDREMVRLQKEGLWVAMQNTYAHRAATILEAVGIRVAVADEAPALAVPVTTLADVDHAISVRDDLGLGTFVGVWLPGADPAITDDVTRRVKVLDPAVGSNVPEGLESGVLHGRLDQLPDSTWIKRARLHLPYVQAPLMDALGGSPGRATAPEDLGGALLTGELFGSLISGRQKCGHVNLV